MSDDFRSVWEQAIAMYRSEKAENERLRAENEALKAADRDHLSAKNGMEKRLGDTIERLTEENRKLREQAENPGLRYRLDGTQAWQG